MATRNTIASSSYWTVDGEQINSSPLRVGGLDSLEEYDAFITTLDTPAIAYLVAATLSLTIIDDDGVAYKIRGTLSTGGGASTEYVQQTSSATAVSVVRNYDVAAIIEELQEKAEWLPGTSIIWSIIPDSYGDAITKIHGASSAFPPALNLVFDPTPYVVFDNPIEVSGSSFSVSKAAFGTIATGDRLLLWLHNFADGTIAGWTKLGATEFTGITQLFTFTVTGSDPTSWASTCVPFVDGAVATYLVVRGANALDYSNLLSTDGVLDSPNYLFTVGYPGDIAGNSLAVVEYFELETGYDLSGPVSEVWEPTWIDRTSSDGVTIKTTVIESDEESGLLKATTSTNDDYPDPSSAPTWQSVSQQYEGANTSITITPPSGAASGDYLVLILTTENGTTMATPSGFTLLGSYEDNGSKLYLWSKTSAGSESNVTISGSFTNAVAQYARLSGVGVPETPISVTTNPTGTYDYAFPTATPGVNTMVLWFASSTSTLDDPTANVSITTSSTSGLAAPINNIISRTTTSSPVVAVNNASDVVGARVALVLPGVVVGAGEPSFIRSIVVFSGSVVPLEYDGTVEIEIEETEHLGTLTELDGTVEIDIEQTGTLGYKTILNGTVEIEFEQTDELILVDRLNGTIEIEIVPTSVLQIEEEFYVMPLPLRNAAGQPQIVQRDDYLKNANIDRSFKFRGPPSPEVTDETLVDATVIWGARLDVFSFGSAATTSGFQITGEIISADSTEWYLKFELDKDDTDIPVGQYNSDIEITLTTGEVVTWARDIIVQVIESFSDPLPE